jgi:hypothetical protein
VAIYEPENWLTDTDRELLQLLAELVTDTPFKYRGNLSPGETALSDEEAYRLVELLDELQSSRKFIEGSYFVEKITMGVNKPDSDLREIFLSWRKHYGRSRALSSGHWRNFLHRLGIENYASSYLVGDPFIQGKQMSYEYFREMERTLLSQRGVSQRIRAIVLTVVDTYAKDVNAARKGERKLPDGAISKLPATIIHSLSSKAGSRSLSSSKIAGLMTAVTDMSVLFTTRDWSVAGTISTIAGGFAAVSTPN